MGTKSIRCHSCEKPLSNAKKVCTCGQATPVMSFKERTEWELQQWRSYLARTGSVLVRR